MDKTKTECDWYRRSVWSAADEADFFARLHRARGAFHKAQYLNIQANYLFDNGFYDAARRLSEKMLADYPEESDFRAGALQRLGGISEIRGEIVAALDYYRQAAEAESAAPVINDNAWLTYAECIVKHGFEDLFGVAESCVASRYDGLFVPDLIYRASAVLAIVSRAKGDLDNFERYRHAARQAAKSTRGIGTRGNLGLAEKDDALERLLGK